MHVTLAVVLLVLAALSSGCRCCTEPDESVVDTAPRAERPRDCHPLEDHLSGESTPWNEEANLFVITELRFGTEHEGFDIDCVDTPGECSSEFCREGPDDGERGVDNRLGPLARKISTVAGSDLQAEMTEAVKSGRHPLLVSVDTISASKGGPVSAIDISFGLDADGDPSDLNTGHGLVKRDPDAPSKRPSRFAPVVIRDGLLSAGPTADWMPLFWTRGQIAAVPVVKAYLQFKTSDDGHLQDGLMAGAISPGNLSNAILDMDARTAKVLTRLGPIVRALVRQQADLDLVAPGSTGRTCSEDDNCLVGQSCRDEGCFEPDQHFDSISFAILFKAVPATVSP